MSEVTGQGSEIAERSVPGQIIRNLGHATLLLGAICEAWAFEVVPADRGLEKTGVLLLAAGAIAEIATWPKPRQNPSEQ